MSIAPGGKKAQDVGSWQQFFVPTYSERIKKAKRRVLRTPEICLERIRAEIKAYEQYKDEPRIVQRARFLETYLKEKTVSILDDELIVGNIGSKPRSALVSMCNIGVLAEELDDPVKDFSIRPYDKMVIHPKERKELREKIIPTAKGKSYSLYEYNLKTVDPDILEHACSVVSSCPHIPVIADVSMSREAGHMFLNFEKEG